MDKIIIAWLDTNMAPTFSVSSLLQLLSLSTIWLT